MSVNLNTNTHYPNSTNQNVPSNPKSSYVGHLIRWLDSSASGNMVKGLAWGAAGVVSGMMATAAFVGGVAMLCLGAAMLPAVGAGAGIMVGGGLLMLSTSIPLLVSINSFCEMSSNFKQMNQLAQAGY